MPHFLKIVFILLYACSLNAQDLGAYGHTFQIYENDLLEYLKDKFSRMTSDDVLSMQKKLKYHYVRLAEMPSPVPNIKEAKNYEISYFDPTITLARDIKDQNGKVILSKGESVNPLTLSNFDQELLFFDGANSSQLHWAQKQPINSKWILVNGRPLEMQEKEQRVVYFDQFGVLAKKLQIRFVPTKVSQEGNKLKIEAFPMEGTCEG